MQRVVILLSAMGVALAAVSIPLHSPHHPKDDARNNTRGHFGSSAARLLTQFRNITAEREVSRGHSLVSLLHILGYSKEDINNMVNTVENTGEQIYKKLTPKERLRLETAGTDFLKMINNANFEMNTALKNLATIKSAVYHHLNPQTQQIVDAIQQASTKPFVTNKYYKDELQ
ncbi:hypothetical protein Pcinc_038104 [Petrolisthes cinctipes]|uniref:Uncharacterized protein n=1 Tax=Petrolisthes cinctipes TaxID=88211 RepID=A0AAE1BRB8_PETCI|nr:hypothetical protein Pcinc_038104 [Petrolisthes cinctipes]